MSLFLQAGILTSFPISVHSLLFYFSSSVNIPFYQCSFQSLALTAGNRAADVGQFMSMKKTFISLKLDTASTYLKILLYRYIYLYTWFCFLSLLIQLHDTAILYFVWGPMGFQVTFTWASCCVLQPCSSQPVLNVVLCLLMWLVPQGRFYVLPSWF